MAVARRAEWWARLAGVLAVVALLALTSAVVFAQDATPVPAGATGAADPEATGPAKVTVGVYVNDIQQLDLQHNSYTLDFYLWLRWTDPEIDPTGSLEMMNPFQLWDTIMTPLYDEPQPMPDGSRYQAFRYQGQFSNKLPLQKYPFDRQHLVVQMEDNTYNEEAFVYVPDTPAVTINDQIALPGYRIGTPTMTVQSHDYPTTFGDLTVPDPTPYSRVVVSVPVTRPALAYVVKVILPIFLVVLVAALVFFINPEYPEARVGMGITALLTLVALQFTTNANLPQVEYLMMLDLLYIASYVFVLFVMAVSVLTSWMATPETIPRTVRLDRRSLVFSLATYAIVVALIVAYELSARS